MDVPALIACSDKDAIVAIHHAWELQTGIQNSELKILAGSGHVALIEMPNICVKFCANFLDRHT
ncbi:MAG: alpha/beta hydrolase [Rhodospirillales bacterium]|nr:alpha/beta hydrolase [Rhodospirillales bacterium]